MQRYSKLSTALIEDQVIEQCQREFTKFRLQGVVTGLGLQRELVTRFIVKSYIQYFLNLKSWIGLYRHLNAVALLKYEKMLICGFNIKDNLALALIALKPGHAVSIYWDSTVNLVYSSSTRTQYFFIQSFQEDFLLKDFLHFPRKPYHDVYPEVFVDINYKDTLFRILYLKFGKQCSIESYKYRNGTQNSPIAMGLLTCHSLAISTASTEPLYYIFILPYSWKTTYLHFKIESMSIRGKSHWAEYYTYNRFCK